MEPLLNVNEVDYVLIVAYVVVTILVGFALKKYMKTSEDFFLSGRSLPTWITGIAFLSANLGALEVIGMVANSAKYGISTVHFYWIGAVPAMVFLGVFMMPFYYSSRIRSVPEYLKYRFNAPTHLLNALSFAVMTLLMSGISIYAMALLFQSMLGWTLTASILLSASVVLVYVFLGGLSSSIYNEVIQFFLIWLGLLPVVFIGLEAAGGITGLAENVANSFVHAWQGMSTSDNPLGVDWLGVVLGLGFVLSFGYWTTDFLVVQRALAAKDLSAAQRTPILAAFPKMLVPIIVVTPGLIAVAVLPEFQAARTGSAEPDYNSTLVLLLAHYLPNGVLGLAITALLASFMSGMAGNVTAFNTVWTYDIYGTYLRKGMPDEHYLTMGKYTTVVGVLISIGAAYIVTSFPNLMDYMQLIFSFFNAPLFATFLLGMFWKRATPWGGFWGLLLGIFTAAVHYMLYRAETISYASDMAANFYQAWWAWLADFIVTIVVSLFTTPRDVKDLAGLVYGLSGGSALPKVNMLLRPEVLGTAALIIMVILNVIFW